jgi:hypothetical protein
MSRPSEIIDDEAIEMHSPLDVSGGIEDTESVKSST